MHTLRVSPVDVQVDAVVFTFNNQSMADQFQLAADTDSDEFIARKSFATQSRAVDCDHEVAGFFE
jgi:hypothetical protein